MKNDAQELVEQDLKALSGKCHDPARALKVMLILEQIKEGLKKHAENGYENTDENSDYVFSEECRNIFLSAHKQLVELRKERGEQDTPYQGKRVLENNKTLKKEGPSTQEYNGNSCYLTKLGHALSALKNIILVK
mgnify:CR=1 FL=1|jgi:hypothetical protein